MLDQQDISKIGSIVTEKNDQLLGDLTALVTEKNDQLLGDLTALVTEKNDQLRGDLTAFVTEEVDALGRMVKDGFDGVDQRFEAVDRRFGAVEGRLDKIEGRLDKIEGRVGNMERNMVTQDFLVDQLAELRGDLVVLTRKENTKVMKLAGMLKEKGILTIEDLRVLFAMEPFPDPRIDLGLV